MCFQLNKLLTDKGKDITKILHFKNTIINKVLVDMPTEIIIIEDFLKHY